MRFFSPPVVVAAWGSLNGVLVSIFAGFGGQWPYLTMYASAVTWVYVLAVLVMFGVRREVGRQVWSHPPHGDVAMIFGLSVLAGGLAFAFYWELILVAILPFILGVFREVSSRRGRGQAPSPRSGLGPLPPTTRRPETSRESPAQHSARTPWTAR